jgi:murein DD-endopeptidase MepM/ murein hydrolase activator NlpD
VVALHEGRPAVTKHGVVELWHQACWELRDVPIVVATPAVIIPPPRRAPRWIPAAVAASLLLGLGFARWTWGSPAASAASLELGSAESVDRRLERTSREQAPDGPVFHIRTEVEAKYAVPSVDGAPLDQVFTSLSGWTHPVTSSEELVPEQGSRLFGSQRIGIERAECGSGHCGIDLDGPRGRPIVAVARGTVVRVERSELGLDGRSGRYVRIEHDDGSLTAYMHLDDVADGLQVRDHVEAGQYLGTLGATAVYSAPPHLHFSLELPNHPGHHGDNTETHYVDPAPFLARATIAKTPERRHAIKPAF